MRTTYITTMPDKAGAFLQASRAISAHDGNIVRVSYNKAVDVHTLFIEVEAGDEDIDSITDDLRDLGYLAERQSERGVLLVALTLPDVPGAVTPVLEVLHRHEVSISYMNSHENGTGWQHFKMGLLVERPRDVKALLDEVSRLCEISILDYDVTEKVLDGTVFYIGFANQMRTLLGLDQDQTNTVLVNANRIMQMLDDRGEAPFKTFDCIGRFAQFVVDHKGERFAPRVTACDLTPRVRLHVVEPPCGSNTFVLEDRAPDARGRLLFVDGGFACYRREMLSVLRAEFEGFDDRPRALALTHGDIDHMGLLDMFDEVLMVRSCYENLLLELEGRPDFREQNPLHAPYSTLSKLITGFVATRPANVRVLGERAGDGVLAHVGAFEFGDMGFDVYEGNGGHVRGETVLVCEGERVAFTGDIVVNIKGYSEEQRAFSMLAPYLMTSVNVDSEKARACRNEVMARFGDCLICPGHGPLMGRPLWGRPQLA